MWQGRNKARSCGKEEIKLDFVISSLKSWELEHFSEVDLKQETIITKGESKLGLSPRIRRI